MTTPSSAQPTPQPPTAAGGHGAQRPPMVTASLLAVGIVVAQAVMLLLFAWPNARLEPRDLPITVAGSPAAVEQVTQALDEAVPGGFDVTGAADEQEARRRITDRDSYGAIVVSPQGTTVLTASGASAVVAQSLQQVAGGLGEAAQGEAAASQATTVQMVDVAPGAAEDPRGVALASSVLPLVITSILCGVLMTLLVARPSARILGVVVFSVLGGLLSTLIVQGFVGALGGSYWANAGVLGLTLLAISASIAGLGAVFGRAGLAAGAATMFLLGNPLSGLASAPELLPQPWGAIGQLLPPGAGGNLLRSTSFFDGAGAARPLIVLLVWAGVGLALLALGHARHVAVTRAERAADAEESGQLRAI